MQDNHRRVDLTELENAASAPILKLDDMNSPLVIESIQLLRKGREYFVHVRSTDGAERSEEHTSELQSHSFISYAVFCLKKKKNIQLIIREIQEKPHARS